jgi:gamma-butyrobetaine dioxygenase
MTAIDSPSQGLDFTEAVSCVQTNGMASFEIESSNDIHLTVSINGEKVKYDWIFLRDACQCPHCLDASSQQKVHHTCDIPLNISPLHNGLRLIDGNALEIRWNEQEPNGHRSVYSFDWLSMYSSAPSINRARFNERPIVHWNRAMIAKVDLHVPCDDYMHTERGLFTALTLLNDYGLVSNI